MRITGSGKEKEIFCQQRSVRLEFNTCSKTAAVGFLWQDCALVVS